MKKRHNLIKKILITLSLCFSVAGSVFAIEEKDYKSMTDRDRILLSISYYEVSMKYEALNNKALANSYRREALKIEPNVVKYYSGEWEVPKKTIEIDWNSIFVDETSDEEEQQTDVTETEEDEDETFDVTDDIDDDYLESLLNGEYLSDDGDAAEDDIDDELLDLLGDDADNNDNEDAESESVQNSDQTDDAVTEKADEPKQEEESGEPSEQHSEVSPTDDGDGQAAKEDQQTPPSDEDNISNDIDEDATDDGEWIPGQTSDADTVIIFSQMVRGFIDGVNAKDADKAVKDIADSVVVQSSAFNMTKDELRDTIASWTAEHNEQIPDYTDILINDEDDGSYTVSVLFDQDFTFLMPMNNKNILFRIVQSDGKYLITEIRMESQQTSEPASANDDQGYLYRFVSMVISGEYEFIAALLAKDVWIAEFNMLFPASEIIDHLQNWAADNQNVKDPAEVIDMQSVTLNDDAALVLLQSIGISADDYEIISFKPLNKTFFPGDPSKNDYTIIVGKSGADEGRISAIIQK